MKYKLSELIRHFGGTLIGDDVAISGIAPTDIAQSGQISFISGNKYKKQLDSCQASAIIVSNKESLDLKLPQITCDNPELYFALVSNLFHPRPRLSVGIHNTTAIDTKVIIGESPAIMPFVSIGKNVIIGKNCQIHPHVNIADNVIIGDNVTIFANVSIYNNVTIGNDCIFHSGVVIGSDGFGNAKDAKHQWHRKPQIGGVQIGNNVDIGANTTIDCGTFTPTIIGNGVVVDNLVQIAHNVIIGDHVAIAACVGIAGGAKIGNYCMIGGSAMITGHIEIADHTVIGGGTGITKSITKPDLYFAIYPFSTFKEWSKNAAHMRSLNTMHQRIKTLEQQFLQVDNNE